MSDALDFSLPKVLVFDPLRGNMLTTRAVLHGIGFRRIEGVLARVPLERRLKDQEVSLLMLEAGEDIPRAVNLVRAIRLGEIEANPFLPIIATLWNGFGDSVAELMNAGCDDVLLRPFSAARLQERARWLIGNRPPFVVTSDYVGPDRGNRTATGFSVEPFDVPNPLRDRALNQASDPVAQAAEIAAACHRVDRERIAKLARRIAMAAEVTIQAHATAHERTGFVIDLIETSAELVKAAKRLKQDDVQDIAAVLEGVAARTATPGPDRAENAQLTRQLALALYAAYAADESDRFQEDLDSTLSLVRARLDRVRERAAKRVSLASLLRAS
jgi:two-component system, OmpR family, phosphate regulon response regulator PhoB